MGTLSVFYRNFRDGPLKQIWNRSGDQGQTWIRQLLQLNQTEPFQIVIEGKVGRNYLSDIAIDDTVFDPNCLLYNFDLPPMPTTVKPFTTTKNPCGDDGFQCKSTGVCIKRSQVKHIHSKSVQLAHIILTIRQLVKVCDFDINCEDGEDEAYCGPCDFETDDCFWKDASIGLYAWQRSNAKLALGPTVDHVCFFLINFVYRFVFPYFLS